MKNLKEDIFRPQHRSTYKKKDLWTHLTIGIQMASKFPSLWRKLIPLLILLASCTTAPVEPVATEEPTLLPTFTSLPTTIAERTTIPSPAPMPITTVAGTFPLDGYIVIFEKDGDLYFQDENNLPIQLTHGGEIPHSPILSDDNKKIVFSRGEHSDGIYAEPNIYSVNSDGSEEQELITPQWLASFGNGMGVKHLNFEPGTHELHFNVCGSQEYSSPCLENSFFVDTDVGEIERSSYNHLYMSPDKKKAFDISSDYIDIVDTNGKVIRENIFPYKVTTPIKIYPDIQWLPDSSGLIVALPVSELLSVYSGNLTYAIWLYKIDVDTAIQIPLDPPPALTYAYCDPVIYLSPDKSLGLYNTKNAELYLWNISNDIFYMYDTRSYCSQPAWDPDNKRFIYRNNFQFLLGEVGEMPIPINGYFVKWIDADHFTYAVVIDEKTPKILVGRIVDRTILTYDLAMQYLIIKPKR